jgi:hypothetical protein
MNAPQTQHYHKWVLITLILAALPSLVTLPIWVVVIACAGASLHYIAPLRKGWGGKVVSAVLLGLAAVGIWFGFESWFSGKAVLSFFIVVVFLKLGESRSRRDYLLLIFAAVVLAAVGALYWENLWSLLHTFVVILALTMSLIAIHGDPVALSTRFLVRMGGQLFLLGLPLMLLLFMTFPRVPGPLWDIGLAFGLPIKAMIDREPGDFGKATTLQPGGIQRASQENGNVLVAEFEGAVPFKSSLYWRGPVFWDYDGESWTLPEDWNNRTRLLKGAIKSQAKLERELRMKGRPVNYTLRVMPNGGRWLYGLDVPAMPAPEAFISEDFQLLSIRETDDREPKFPMLAYLDYQVGSSLSDVNRARGLAWPEGTNPRIQALGKELAAQYPDSEDLVLQVFRRLAEEGYQFDATYSITPGPDLLDRYFFDEKKGGAEYLAGSFAMLMRAAGVPARLVSGYRGGTIIALTNFVIVKRSDAHAWLEVWHDGKGWVKVEPKDIVQPPDPKDRAQPAQAAKTPESRIDIEELEARPTQTKRSAGGHSDSASSKEGIAWQLPDFATLFSSLRKWVIHYDPERQVDLLEEVGMEESNWMDLLLSGVIGVLGILCVYFGVAQWRGRIRRDPVTQAWLKFCARVDKIGIPKLAEECPRSYLERACREKPELTDALKDVVGRYIDIRYGDADSAEAIALFKRQVERFVAMT